MYLCIMPKFQMIHKIHKTHKIPKVYKGDVTVVAARTTLVAFIHFELRFFDSI